MAIQNASRIAVQKLVNARCLRGRAGITDRSLSDAATKPPPRRVEPAGSVSVVPPPSAEAFISRHFAVADMDNTVRAGGNIAFVGDKHKGVPGLLQAIEQAHDLIAGRRVEVACGLVSENDRGIVH